MLLIRLAIVLKLVDLLLKVGQTACNCNNISSSGSGSGSRSHRHNLHHHYNSASLAKTLKSMPFQNCAGIP